MPQRDTWIFGYGSLIWKPGFAYIEKRRAEVAGFRRSFCMASIHYRGTPEAPGLVLALDREPEARCAGLAFRPAPEAAEAVLAYLRERELISSAYDEAVLPLRLEDGREVEATGFIVNRAHSQYRGGLSLEEQAEVIATAVGPMGPNVDYLLNTLAGLDALGLPDPDLARLAALVASRRAPPLG
ncbi:MAG: gamma-glutamylcyclotransferase [Amaricoccus sp.]